MNTTPKRGRPPGAKSLINITLKQLNELFGPDTAVPVGAVWIREFGISVQAPAPIMVTAAPEERESEPQIQFSVTRFNEESEPAHEEVLIGEE